MSVNSASHDGASDSTPPPISLGWEEWVSLPELGLPAIKAKIDTGARTSSLHAIAIEPFGSEANPQVRFIMQPNPNDLSVQVTCSAKVVGKRSVTSSNGETEMRFVINTPLKIGTHIETVNVTLTNRETMSYRMLIGRSSITANMNVVPSESFIQPVIGFEAYKKHKQKSPTRRPLRIAILTQDPDNYSNNSMINAAEKRGHIIDCVETSRCCISINNIRPDVHFEGRPLPKYDAIIPRIGAPMTFYGMAVVRQFETMGVYCVNSSNAIGTSRDKLMAHQMLAKHDLDMPNTAFAMSYHDTKALIDLAGGVPVLIKLLSSTQGNGVILAQTQQAAESLIDSFRGLRADFLVQEFVKEASGTDIRCFVVDGKIVGSMQRTALPGEFRSNLHRGGTARWIKLTDKEHKTALRAAKILGLTVAGVDLLRTHTGPKILEVNSSPGLEGIESVTGKNIADKIIQAIERNTPSLMRRTKTQFEKAVNK